MASVHDQEHDVKWAAPDGSLISDTPDWRESAPSDDVDPDDEELSSTPSDVVAVLGFDPMELSEK